MSLADRLKQQISIKPKAVWVPEPEILLCPNIPKPLSGINPRTVLGDKWWKETRQAAYSSTNYHCLACGVHKLQAVFRQWLEGHEQYDIDYAKGIAKYVRTVPLCHCCHAYIHDGRLHALLEKGQITHAKYVAIIQHGDGVLFRAGRKRLPHEERCRIIESGPIAPWYKWRMLVNRRKYRPIYKDLAAWQKAFE